MEFDSMDELMHSTVSKTLASTIRSRISLDPNFKINQTLTVNFQMKTSIDDGLILWIEDPVEESSFTIEIQHQQVSNEGHDTCRRV
jgi:hypothetical protein